MVELASAVFVVKIAVADALPGTAGRMSDPAEAELLPVLVSPVVVAVALIVATWPAPTAVSVMPTSVKVPPAIAGSAKVNWVAVTMAGIGVALE